MHSLTQKRNIFLKKNNKLEHFSCLRVLIFRKISQKNSETFLSCFFFQQIIGSLTMHEFSTLVMLVKQLEHAEIAK